MTDRPIKTALEVSDATATPLPAAHASPVATLRAMAGTVAALRAETAARLAEPTTTRDRAALDLLLLDIASVAAALTRALDSAQWMEEEDTDG